MLARSNAPRSAAINLLCDFISIASPSTNVLFITFACRASSLLRVPSIRALTKNGQSSRPRPFYSDLHYPILTRCSLCPSTSFSLCTTGASLHGQRTSGKKKRSTASLQHLCIGARRRCAISDMNLPQRMSIAIIKQGHRSTALLLVNRPGNFGPRKV